MSKFTPGPWSLVVPADGTDCGGLYGANGEQICWFGDNEQYYPSNGYAPNEADARLIAEAPLMYAELVKARAALWRVIEDNCGGIPDDYEEIRSIDAALARATGGNDE